MIPYSLIKSNMIITSLLYKNFSILFPFRSWKIISIFMMNHFLWRTTRTRLVFICDPTQTTVPHSFFTWIKREKPREIFRVNITSHDFTWSFKRISREAQFIWLSPLACVCTYVRGTWSYFLIIIPIKENLSQRNLKKIYIR